MDYTEFRRWYSEQISMIDASCYKVDFDELVEIGSQNLFYGDKEMEDLEIEDIYEALSEVEK